MSNLSDAVFDVATRVSSPLALSGLALAILFFIFRQLLAKNIFPRLSRAIGGALLRQIVDRLFVLALIAMILGFAGYLLSLREKPSPSLPPTASAERLLEQMYEGNFKDVYEQFPEPVRSQMPYTKFVVDMKVTFSQFSSPPAYRRLTSKQLVAGSCIMTFEAEFDQLSRFRETLSYVMTDKGWTAWNITVAPEDWPLPNSLTLLQMPSASSLQARVGAVEQEDRSKFIQDEVSDRWVLPAGWTARVEEVRPRLADRTCDMKLVELDSGVPIFAKRVLDGCNLPKGQRITLVGRVSIGPEDSIEVASVRYWRPA